MFGGGKQEENGSTQSASDCSAGSAIPCKPKPSTSFPLHLSLSIYVSPSKLSSGQLSSHSAFFCILTFSGHGIKNCIFELGSSGPLKLKNKKQKTKKLQIYSVSDVMISHRFLLREYWCLEGPTTLTGTRIRSLGNLFQIILVVVEFTYCFFLVFLQHKNNNLWSGWFLSRDLVNLWKPKILYLRYCLKLC